MNLIEITRPTTDATMQQDLQASFRTRTGARIEELLNEIGHAEDDAECYAQVIPRLMDPELYEAWVMLIAGQLFKADHPRATRRLITEDHWTRGKYVRRGLLAVSTLLAALQGQSDPQVLQAAADMCCHRALGRAHEQGKLEKARAWKLLRPRATDPNGEAS